MPPPTRLDENYMPYAFACSKCNYALGVVMRDTDRITKLWVFWGAIVLTNLPDVTVLRAQPPELFTVHGLHSCDGIECSNCGELNAWSMAEKTRKRLISHYQKTP